MKKLSAILAATGAGLTMTCITAAAGNFDYYVDDSGNAIVTKVDNVRTVRIESVRSGHAVTELRSSAFMGCSKTVLFFIPDSVTKIDERSVGYYIDEDMKIVKNEGITIFTESEDSAAAKYARANGFQVKHYIEAPSDVFTYAGSRENMEAYAKSKGLWLGERTVTDENGTPETLLEYCLADMRQDNAWDGANLTYYFTDLKYAREDNGILYMVDDDKAWVVAFSEPKTAYVIPDIVFGKKVEGIRPTCGDHIVLLDSSGNWSSSGYFVNNHLHAYFSDLKDTVRIILPRECTVPFLDIEYVSDEETGSLGPVKKEPYILVQDEKFERLDAHFYYYQGSKAEEAVLATREESALRREYHELVYGDVNFDGEINVTDLVLTAAHVRSIKALNEAAHLVADIDVNEYVNVTDLSAIAAHVKGIRDLPS
ncbi:dockerin type I repeat-containing protein [Ruminococcus sp.]|uniref:dockerin type I repeat-containing protein n=1 Tax=Ruminococcus sp. TaxID=41978 RepID=UPI0025E68866|nr:dockerin type I repeat-containing protein [Ruminococcus sp.]MBQ8967754.1 dockerin type I repeat-containing protein [Ruminococcus sp.]